MAVREFHLADAHQYNHQSVQRWLFSHIFRYPLLPIVALVGMLCTSSLYSWSSVLVGQAFDMMLTQPSTQALLTIALLVLVARAGVGVLDLIRVAAVELLAQRLERDARDELYLSLLGKSQTFHNRQQVGDVMARATNDVQQLNLMVSPGASLIIESVLFTLIPLLAMSQIKLDLLIVPIIFLVVFILALRRYNDELNPVTGSLRGQFGIMNAALAESVSGIEVVKGYAQEAAERKKFSLNARNYRDLFVREGGVKARYLPLLLYGIAFGCAFGHALWLYRDGVLTIGQIVAYMGLFGTLRFPTFISLFSFSLVQLGIAGSERILELIRAETTLDEHPGAINKPIDGAIAFENVSFGYNDTGDAETAPSLVMQDISFYAKPGETIAIVGQTGAGKSTLTRLVNRTYDATNGRVLIDGHDVRDWSLDSLRSQISTIEQDIFLFSRSLADNIAVGAAGNATREQVIQAAKEAQAHDFIMTFPDGYDTVVGERGVTLSGGQRQRIAIARAFLTNPRILILDDSTSAIDSATEDQIQRAIRHILQGRTTLLITHRISQIRWADRILVLRQGKLVAQGTHEELITTSDAYRRIFDRYVHED